MATFLSMTNTDLEEVGITDAEEKLSILDAIVEIKVSQVTPSKILLTIIITNPMPIVQCSLVVMFINKESPDDHTHVLTSISLAPLVFNVASVYQEVSWKHKPNYNTNKIKFMDGQHILQKYRNKI